MSIPTELDDKTLALLLTISDLCGQSDSVRRKPKDDSRFALEVGMAEVIRGSILKFPSAG